MSKVMIRYTTYVREVIELPDEYDEHLHILDNREGDDEEEVSLYRVLNYIDDKLPSGAELVGVYDEQYTKVYYEE